MPVVLHMKGSQRFPGLGTRFSFFAVVVAYFLPHPVYHSVIRLLLGILCCNGD